ncbi:MAG: L,D-transpeptidase family protein [Deltaproteobacteria bacterium]|nr:L,D-transpeptidase family protein [Deltaproteobacteria bacterium]
MRAIIKGTPGILILLGLLACTPAELPVEQPYSETVGSRLRAKIESDRGLSQFSCRQEILCGSSVIPAFYQRRGFAPAWNREEGPLPQADSLIGTIRESAREGLNQYDYHLYTIELLLSDRREKHAAKTPIDPEKEADLDLLLTDAFLLFGSHLLAGRVNPETLHTDWVAYNPGTDLAALLESALAGDNVATTLRSLLPPHPGYAGLQNALMRYRDLAQTGGWPNIPAEATLRKGDRSESVDLLRERLPITGDMDLSVAEESSPFDEALETAVRRFQRRHGLADDGVVGRDTLAALNVPVEERVRQIVLNMERWRWIPHDMGNRHILVNIPDYKMSVVENSEIRMDMRIIVGKDYTATPVFSGSIKYLEVNPYWNIPHSISVEEILPKIRKDPAYLENQKIRVFETWRENAPEIDPATVDWNEVEDRGFSFKLRQDPGPLNPLGRVKFIFPNKFAVYLHDTPARGLFQNPTRGFSHGCIRVEKPLNLAVTLLGDDIRHSREKILEAIESGVRETIPLREPMPVHILYWTAWVDEGGTIQFRKDIYARDNPLEMALKESPPVAGES